MGIYLCSLRGKEISGRENYSYIFFSSSPPALPGLSHWPQPLLLLDPSHSEEGKHEVEVNCQIAQLSSWKFFPTYTKSTCSVYPSSFYFLGYL